MEIEDNGMDEDEGEDRAEGVVQYDEIDSSRTVDEEVEAFILQETTNPSVSQLDAGLDHDVHIIGAHVERYTGHEFPSHTYTTEWMAWDAASHK